MFAQWQRIFDDAGAVRPECWESGTVKPDGHTLSVADIYFVAHRLRLLSTHRAQITHLGLLLTAYYSPLTAYCLLLTAYYPPLTAHCLLLTAY